MVGRYVFPVETYGPAVLTSLAAVSNENVDGWIRSVTTGDGK